MPTSQKVIDLHRAILDDPETRANFIASTIRRHIVAMKAEMRAERGDDPADAGWLAFAQSHMEGWFPQALSQIDQHAESPIERLFLGTLVAGAMIAEPFGMIVVAPQPDAHAYLERTRDLYTMGRWFEQMVSASVAKGRTREEARMGVRQFLIERNGPRAAPELDDIETHGMMADFYEDAIHLMLQPGFPGIRVEGRTIRCDALAYVPARPSVRVVLEADGFEYHSSPEAFVRDRKRDRALGEAGYTVSRYAGREIVADPVSVASEFLLALRTRKEAAPLREHPPLPSPS